MIKTTEITDQQVAQAISVFHERQTGYPLKTVCEAQADLEDIGRMASEGGPNG